MVRACSSQLYLWSAGRIEGWGWSQSRVHSLHNQLLILAVCWNTHTGTLCLTWAVSLHGGWFPRTESWVSESSQQKSYCHFMTQPHKSCSVTCFLEVVIKAFPSSGPLDGRMAKFWKRDVELEMLLWRILESIICYIKKWNPPTLWWECQLIHSRGKNLEK